MNEHIRNLNREMEIIKKNSEKSWADKYNIYMKNS